MIKIGTSFKDYVQIIPQITVVLLISDIFGGGKMCPPHHYQHSTLYYLRAVL